MSSRNLLNLVLLAVVTLLIVFVVLEPEQQPAQTAVKLTTLKPQAVDNIRLFNSNGNEIQLHKTKGIWYMDKPYSILANDFRVQSLLRLLQTDSFAQHDLKKLEPKKFGLEPARARVIFNDELTIEFGATEPLQQHRYVRIADTLHLIIDTFYYQVAGKETVYMSHALLPPGKLHKLTLPDFTLSFIDNKWQLQPAREDISADAMTDLLNHWRNAQAIEVTPYQGRARKPDIMVEFADGNAYGFTYIKDETGIRLLRNDINMQYLLTEDAADSLFKLPEAVADTNPLATTSKQ